MKHKLAWACLLGCMGMTCLGGGFSVPEIGGEAANPYSEVITNRNIFALVPEPPPKVVDVKLPDLPKVMLTGFVGKGGSTKILLAILPTDKKEPTYYTTLTPGEKDHDVELLDIHIDKEEVDILNSGTRQTLSVKSNSYDSVASASPAPARPPGGRPMPRGFPPGLLFHRPPRS